MIAVASVMKSLEFYPCMRLLSNAHTGWGMSVSYMMLCVYAHMYNVIVTILDIRHVVGLHDFLVCS